MVQLSLSYLGPFQVTLDGEPVTGFKSNKVRALLAYLAVEADRPHRREVLAGLLWPDWPDRDALNNLRYALSNLRQVVGDRTAKPPFLIISRDTLQFNISSDCRLDVAAFLAGTERVLSMTRDPPDLARVEGAVPLYRGAFLEGFSLRDSAAFEEWTLLKRQQIAQVMLSALRYLATSYEQGGQYEQALAWARRQIELEPWDEVAQQQLMRLLALSGQRSAALGQFETCRRLLAEELGVEPAPETIALYEQIRTGKLKTLKPAPASQIAQAAGRPLFLEEESPHVEIPVFVARERELAKLAGILDLALAGVGQVAFVTGEAGGGKTALTQEFSRWAQELYADLGVAVGNCNAYTGIGDPYLPFREILEWLTGEVEAKWAAGAITREHARRLWHMLPVAVQALVELGPDLIDTFVSRTALLQRVMSYGQEPGRADWLAKLREMESASIRGASGPQQRDLFEQYTRVLQALAQQGPLLLVVDDLQWADLGSISLLFHLGRHLAGSRIMIVGAYRREEVTAVRDGDRHPLEPVVNEFQREFGDIVVNVNQAEHHHFVDSLVGSEPNRLGQDFRGLLFRQTRGNPLFTVELLRGMQERGDLVKDPDERWAEGPALDWETLPARVEAAIAERIGRLPEPLQAELRIASVEGEIFTAEVVARVLAAERRVVVEHLSRESDRRHRLIRAQAIERLGPRRLSRYRFRNYLFQKYLYDHLDEVERAYLHEDVGRVLEELYGDQVSEIAVQLAWHFQKAGLVEKTTNYLCQAGQKAVQLSAYQEGIRHLTRGQELLLTLPDSTERAQQELALQLALGIAWQGAKGIRSSEVARTLARARELCQQVGGTAQLCQVLGETAIFHYVGAEYQAARELAQESLSLAQQARDPLLVALSQWHLGFVYFGLGEYTTAQAQFEQVISFYEPDAHHHPFVVLGGKDAGVGALAYNACCLCCLGYPEQGLRQSQAALTLARELKHLFSLADALCFAGCLFQAMRLDALALKENAEELMRLADERVPGWRGIGQCYLGQALAMLGQTQVGIEQMRQGLSIRRSTDQRSSSSETLVALARALADGGRLEEAWDTLAEALALTEETDERYWEAELYRLRAELHLINAAETEAEASFQQAIDAARRQGAKLLELRATTSLACLWQKQQKTEQARAVLEPIYDWFTEGFDTPDLTAAAALLRELA